MANCPFELPEALCRQLYAQQTENAAAQDVFPDYDPEKYPGTALRWGAVGLDVANMQTRLDRLAGVYTAINTQKVDGRFGQNMYHAVVRYQRQMGLTPDGVIGRGTWQSIVQADNALMAGTVTPVTAPYPGYVIGRGAAGDNVRLIQSYMGAIPGLPAARVDGVFGAATQTLVRAFQTRFGLKVDGLVGRDTWSAMVREFNALH